MDPCPQHDEPAMAIARRPSHFFAISVWKLAVMSLATAGIYELFWFYRHWQSIRERTGERLSPPLRALFNIVFAYTLFRRIGDEAPPGQVAPLLLALVFVAVGVASLLPLPEPWSFVGLLAILPLLEVQAQANKVNAVRTPEAATNSTFTRANVLGLTCCAAAWTLAIAAMVEARRDPGSAANLKAAAATAKRGLPRAVNDDVKLVDVIDEPRQLSYSYVVTDAAAPRFRDGPYRQHAGRAHIVEACGHEALRRLLDANVTIRHTYRDRAREALLVLTVKGADCGPARPGM
jgi:hypothetical protein